MLITALEAFPGLETWELEMHAIDISPRVLDIARQGEYTQWSLR